MRYQNIPRGAKNVAHVPLIMWAGLFGRFNIATHSMMAAGDKGVAHDPGFFACNEYGKGVVHCSTRSKITVIPKRSAT